MIISSSGACFVVNRHLKIEHWNDSMTHFMGMSQEESLRQPCYDIFQARSFTGLNFCQTPCPLLTASEDDLEEPLTLAVPTRFTGQQLVQVQFALWDDPLTIIHWIHPLNRDFTPVAPLTPRQHEIFTLLSQGKTRTDIGRILNIALSTVNTHIRRVCDMWDVPTERHALTYFLRLQSQGHTPSNRGHGSNTT